MNTNMKWISTSTYTIKNDWSNINVEQQIYDMALSIYLNYIDIEITHNELVVAGLCDTIRLAMRYLKIEELELNQENFPRLFDYKPQMTYVLNPKFWYTPYREEGGHLIRLAILKSLSSQ